MPCPEPVLDLTGVTGLRGTFRVGVERLVVHPGDAVAIVGHSGAGKSTVLDMLAGVLRPTSAERFLLCGTDIAALWLSDNQEGLRAARAAHIGYVLQTGGLAPFLTIAENVALPFWRDGATDGGRVGETLAALGIGDLAGRRPRAVSVGQRQRAAIARALVNRPALVLADEPTAALDMDTAEEVMSLLVATCRERGSAMVMVTHDRALAESHGLNLIECARAGPGQSRLAA